MKTYLPRFRDGVMFKGGLLKLTGPGRRINPLESNPGKFKEITLPLSEL